MHRDDEGEGGIFGTLSVAGRGRKKYEGFNQQTGKRVIADDRYRLTPEENIAGRILKWRKTEWN